MGFFLKIQNFQKCQEHGIKFIASPEMIRMGDKASAKATMIEAGARCSWFSWYSGVIRTSARVGTIFGYPVMLKATAGGGGKECVRSGKMKIY
jgi:acetyl-CoA carboxylase biotin carboxylase subunit